MHGEKGILRPYPQHTFRFLLSVSGGSSSSAGTLSSSSMESSPDSSTSCQVREAEVKHERNRKRHLLLNTLLGWSLPLCDLLFSLFNSRCFFGWCGFLLWLSFFICAIYLFAFIFSFLGTPVSALLGAELNEGNVCLGAGL